ncbi:putative cyclase [Flagelloscypha sp. PMI_526]|nr:putative cyclase [Flagelloscypha sp. PMI_526]
MTLSFVDLTHPLKHDMLVYPGDPEFLCHPKASVASDGYSVHSVSFGTHTGTHIDAPSHFFEGAMTVDQIPLSSLLGPVLVIDLQNSPTKCCRELCSCLNTGFNRYWGTRAYFDHPFLDKSAAQHVIETGIRFIGIDTLSPDETHLDDTKGDFGVHETVLGAGGILAENLTNLEQLLGGEYIASFLPLAISQCDGSPVRAAAWQTGMAMKK